MVQECDGVAFPVDGGALGEPWEVTRFFGVCICPRKYVGGGGGIDAHGGSELEPSVLGVTVEFSVAGHCVDDGGFVDLDVTVCCGLGDNERAGFFKERRSLGALPEDSCFHGGSFVGGLLREKLLMDLVAAFHVPAVEGTGETVYGDFHPTDVDASVMSEASARAFGDRGGACRVHDVKERLVGFVKSLGRAFVVGVLVSSDGFALEENVEVVTGGVHEREVGCVRTRETNH